MTGLLGRLVSAERPQGAGRVAVLVAAAAALAALALPNLLFEVALRIFYLAPVAVVTVLVSARWGAAFAVAAGVVWTFDRVGEVELQGPAELLTGVLRVAGCLLLVAFVSTLRDALDRAKASERSSKEFLAFAAHQLRTPVAGVRASAEALLVTQDPDNREQLLFGITREAGRMGRLVAALLRMTRLDQGERLAPAATDVAAVVREEIRRAQVLAPALEVDLHVEGPLAPAVVDGAALGEVVANLLDNARRHAASRIDVGLRLGDRHLGITVSDDGPGLPEGAEGEAFERFVSLDGHGGSGLGLAIARALAEAHGGSLRWDGTRFVLRVAVEPGR